MTGPPEAGPQDPNELTGIPDELVRDYAKYAYAEANKHDTLVEDAGICFICICASLSLTWLTPFLLPWLNPAVPQKSMFVGGKRSGGGSADGRTGGATYRQNGKQLSNKNFGKPTSFVNSSLLQRMKHVNNPCWRTCIIIWTRLRDLSSKSYDTYPRL